MESEALDAYLLWEFSKKTVQEALERSPVNRDRILSSMALARELIAGFSPDEKIKMVRLFSPFSLRAEKLGTKRWTLEAYPVSELGTVLSCVGDLPLEEIVKSFVEVADHVRQQVEGNSVSVSVKYIRSLLPITDILETIPVMVIEPGSEQRRLDEMVRVWGQRDWRIHEAKGYIEDGNHRALALELSNPRRKSILCWVGRPV